MKLYIIQLKRQKISAVFDFSAFGLQWSLSLTHPGLSSCISTLSSVIEDVQLKRTLSAKGHVHIFLSRVISGLLLSIGVSVAEFH